MQRNSQEERKTGNVSSGKKNTSEINGYEYWENVTHREDNWKLIGRNNVGKPEERILEKRNRKNEQDDGKWYMKIENDRREILEIWKL